MSHILDFYCYAQQTKPNYTRQELEVPRISGNLLHDEETWIRAYDWICVLIDRGHLHKLWEIAFWHRKPIEGGGYYNDKFE